MLFLWVCHPMADYTRCRDGPSPETKNQKFLCGVYSDDAKSWEHDQGDEPRQHTPGLPMGNVDSVSGPAGTFRHDGAGIIWTGVAPPFPVLPLRPVFFIKGMHCIVSSPNVVGHDVEPARLSCTRLLAFIFFGLLIRISSAWIIFYLAYRVLCKKPYRLIRVL